MLYSSRVQSLMVGKSGQQELEAPSHSVSGARSGGGGKGVNASAQLAFWVYTHTRILVHDIVQPTIKVDLPSLINMQSRHPFIGIPETYS